VERTLLERGEDPMYARTLEMFEDMLSRNFARVRNGRIYPLTGKQMITLEDYWIRRFEELAPRGIMPRLIRYPYGTAIRFGIEKVRGWFSWKTIKEKFKL
jgi:hypothetical protein